MPTPMLDAALALAARGFRIIPLYDPGPDGKRPRINDWQKHATTDPAIIRAWWTKWPNANVGGAMGGPERVIAIDIDGHKGSASWSELLARNPWPAPTLQSNSGSGDGCHLFFRLQPHHDLARIRNAIKFRPGLDVRAEGGQVVLPPSIHTSGRAYSFTSIHILPAPLPDWLYDILATDPALERKPEAHTPRDSPPLIERIEGARRAVLALPMAISGQGGHNAILVAATTAYRGFDLPRAAAEVVLEEFNRELARPPFSPAELAHKLDAVETNERVGEQWGYLLDVDDMSAALAPDVEPERAPADLASGVQWQHWAVELATPVEPTRWVVPELQICPGRPTMLAGYGASGKTLLAQALLLAFASGKPIWSAFTGARRGRARHFDHEQGTHATKKRYQRLARGLGVELGAADVDLAVASFPDVYLNAKNAREAYALTFAGTDVAVVDALRGAIPGEDENDSKVRTFIDNLGWVSERTGTAFILIHHAGKVTQSDERAGPRGSSAIFDGCGCVLSISADDAEGPKMVRQIKQPAEGEGPVAPFMVAIEDVDGHDGLRVSYRAPEALVTPSDRVDAKLEAVLAFLNGNPGVPGRMLLEERMGQKHGALKAVLEVLLDDGRVVNRGTANRPRLFTRETAPAHLVAGDV